MKARSTFFHVRPEEVRFHRDLHLVFHKVFATKRFVLDGNWKFKSGLLCLPATSLRPQMVQRFQLQLLVSLRRFGLQDGLGWHWKFGLAHSENNQKQDEQFHCSFFTLLLDMEQTPCCLLLWVYISRCFVMELTV